VNPDDMQKKERKRGKDRAGYPVRRGLTLLLLMGGNRWLANVASKMRGHLPSLYCTPSSVSARSSLVIRDGEEYTHTSPTNRHFWQAGSPPSQRTLRFRHVLQATWREELALFG